MRDLGAAKSRIKELGSTLSADIMVEMRRQFAPLLLPADPSVKITRDLVYGDDARHRLNIFAKSNTTGAPVLIFVHGGGFVTGDKEEEPGAFYDNVGLWAAAQGIVCATLNYRLAPQHPWPAGRDDVAAALYWIRQSIAEYGGDPTRLFLMGHSAGAAHVAAAIGQAQTRTLLAGCICMSGLYDLAIGPVNPAYFGAPELHAERSPLNGLASAPFPLLSIVAEYDPPFIQQHTLSLWRERLSMKGALPRLFQSAGHNHFSTAFHFNTEDRELGQVIARFIAGV